MTDEIGRDLARGLVLLERLTGIPDAHLRVRVREGRVKANAYLTRAQAEELQRWLAAVLLDG